jgi:hypothetical protein
VNLFHLNGEGESRSIVSTKKEIKMSQIEENEIWVEEADNMPLERWTAYMHCTAIGSHLYPNYYLVKNDGKSLIKRKENYD